MKLRVYLGFSLEDPDEYYTLIEVASNLKPADFELLFSKIYEPEVENEPTGFYQTATRYVLWGGLRSLLAAGCWFLF